MPFLTFSSKICAEPKIGADKIGESNKVKFLGLTIYYKF